MATKQTFIQIVDKKSGKIEEVVNSKTLDAMDIDKKIALTKGKELYIVTHRVEPVIKIEMKQKKIIEPVRYIEPEQSLTLEVEKQEDNENKDKKEVTEKNSKNNQENQNATPKKVNQSNSSKVKKSSPKKRKD